MSPGAALKMSTATQATRVLKGTFTRKYCSALKKPSRQMYREHDKPEDRDIAKFHSPLHYACGILLLQARETA
jgi:hypothetical protein